MIHDDLACNIVRTSHYPQSRHFLDACDEIGLLVFEEIPGWQFIGDEPWKQLALRNIEAMIVRDRNRPSIILWGDASTNHATTTTSTSEPTNWLINSTPSGPTGGVRNFAGSELLEDVYTMNDFEWTLDARLAASHDRYLNTEYCGHMYPSSPSTAKSGSGSTPWLMRGLSTDSRNEIGGWDRLVRL